MTDRHLTASAIVLHGDHVLLVHHRKTGLWLYPGGHIEPGETPAETVVREVLEETGIQAAFLEPSPFTHPGVAAEPTPFTVFTIDVADPAAGPHQHIDMIYLKRPRTTVATANCDGITMCRWTRIDQLATLHTSDELPDLISTAARNTARIQAMGVARRKGGAADTVAFKISYTERPGAARAHARATRRVATAADEQRPGRVRLECLARPHPETDRPDP